MENEPILKSIQKSVVTLEEAFDLNEHYIRGVYFPNTPDLLGRGMIFDFDEKEVFSLISPRAYAIKRDMSQKRAEFVDIGPLWKYKIVLNYIVEDEKLRRTAGMFNDKSRNMNT